MSSCASSYAYVDGDSFLLYFSKFSLSRVFSVPRRIGLAEKNVVAAFLPHYVLVVVVVVVVVIGGGGGGGVFRRCTRPQHAPARFGG